MAAPKPATKAAKAPADVAPRTPTPPKESSARTVHLLIRTGDDGAIHQLENFTGELNARRALDGRPSWQYLSLVPGKTYTANSLGGVSSDG